MNYQVDSVWNTRLRLAVIPVRGCEHSMADVWAASGRVDGVRSRLDVKIWWCSIHTFHDAQENACEAVETQTKLPVRLTPRLSGDPQANAEN